MIIAFTYYRLIDEEQPKIIPREFGWTAYYRLGEIYAWIDEKIRQYPKLLTNYTVGTTYENRTIRAVKLSYKPVSRSFLKLFIQLDNDSIDLLPGKSNHFH